jgi:hypothetical protein
VFLDRIYRIHRIDSKESFAGLASLREYLTHTKDTKITKTMEWSARRTLRPHRDPYLLGQLLRGRGKCAPRLRQPNRETGAMRGRGLIESKLQFGEGDNTQSLFENCEGCCGEKFWPRPRRRGPSIPEVGCKDRANAGLGQKIRRPEGWRQREVFAFRCSFVCPQMGARITRASFLSMGVFLALSCGDLLERING